jgi:hypothetical protein
MLYQCKTAFWVQSISGRAAINNPHGKNREARPDEGHGAGSRLLTAGQQGAAKRQRGSSSYFCLVQVYGGSCFWEHPVFEVPNPVAEHTQHALPQWQRQRLFASPQTRPTTRNSGGAVMVSPPSASNTGSWTGSRLPFSYATPSGETSTPTCRRASCPGSGR